MGLSKKLQINQERSNIYMVILLEFTVTGYIRMIGIQVDFPLLVDIVCMHLFNFLSRAP